MILILNTLMLGAMIAFMAGVVSALWSISLTLKKILEELENQTFLK